MRERILLAVTIMAGMVGVLAPRAAAAEPTLMSFVIPEMIATGVGQNFYNGDTAISCVQGAEETAVYRIRMSLTVMYDNGPVQFEEHVFAKVGGQCAILRLEDAVIAQGTFQAVAHKMMPSGDPIGPPVPGAF